MLTLPTAESFYGPRLRRVLGRVLVAADERHGDARWLTLAEETGIPVAYWAAFLYGDAASDAPGLTVAHAALVVHVRHGRWLVRCDCGSCQYASELDRRFYCVTCLNQSAEGAFRTVAWPDSPHAIERVLLSRPRNRQHWLPHETIDDLERQNRQLAAMAA